MISWAERRGIVRCGGMLSDKDDPRQQRREVAPGELGKRQDLDFSISIANGQSSGGAFTASPGLGNSPGAGVSSPLHLPGQPCQHRLEHCRQHHPPVEASLPHEQLKELDLVKWLKNRG